MGKYSRKELQNIAALEKRRDWLKKRYATTKLSYDGSEMRAITWALEVVKAVRGPWADKRTKEIVDESG